MTNQRSSNPVLPFIKVVTSHKKVFWAIFKIILGLALFASIYYQVSKQEDLGSIANSITANLSLSKSLYLLVVLVLMFLNWTLEAQKWRLLLKDFSLSLGSSLKGIWVGQSIGIMTPANLGDYGGRQLVLNKKHLSGGLSATLVSSLAQNVVNVVFGLIAALYFSLNYTEIGGWIPKAALFFVLLCILLILFLYRNASRILPIAQSYVFESNRLTLWKNKLLFYLKPLQSYKASDFDQSLALSTLRYLTYLSQYVILLHFFGIDLPIGVAIAGVACIFLVQTGLPLPPVLGFMARGEVALIIWTFFGAAPLSILAATFTLWVINKIIPAMLGMFALASIKVRNDED